MGYSVSSQSISAGGEEVVEVVSESCSVSKEWIGVEFWCTDVDEDQVSLVILSSTKGERVVGKSELRLSRILVCDCVRIADP